MYNFDYEITSYETDDEYRSHFLKIFNSDDIMSDDVKTVLDDIYNLIKDDNDWNTLLSLLIKNYFPIMEMDLDMALPIAFSYTFLEQTHKCLYEFKKNNTTNLVKEFIQNVK
jgi:hypothetical protein|tara:strand:- start:638 stop:973 length:336 start_codon:yes stop_codon:yes gene_type:complete